MRVKKDAHWIFLTGGTSLLEQLAFMKPSDVLIAIDFFQVPREVQTALQHAKKVGAPILGITDFPSSPIAKAADVCLYAKRGLHTTVNSLTPAFSLVNALAIAVVWAKKADSIKALTDLDTIIGRTSGHNRFIIKERSLSHGNKAKIRITVTPLL